MIKEKKSNFITEIFVSAKNKVFSPLNAFRTFILLLPILLIGMQYVFIIQIVNKYISVFMPQTILLIAVTFSQIPCLVVYRIVNNMELLPKMQIFMLLINVAAPIINLLLYYFVQQDIIVLSNFMLGIYSMLVNIAILIAFAVFVFLNKKKLFALAKPLMYAALIASVSQFIIVMATALDFGVNSLSVHTSSFTGIELTVLIVSITWFIVWSIAINGFIKWKTKHIAIFNRISRYELSGIISIPISLIIIGIYNLMFSKSGIDTLTNFIHNPILFAITTASAIALNLVAVVLIILNINKKLSTSFLRIFIVILTIINISIAAFCFAVTDERGLIGWSLLIGGIFGVLMHLLFSCLNSMSLKESPNNAIIEFNHLLIIISIGVIAIVTTLHYDVIISQKAFAPNLILILLELILLGSTLINYSRVQSLSLLKKE